MEDREDGAQELKKIDFEKLEVLRNRMEAFMAEKTALVNQWIPKEVFANIKSDEEIAAEEAELFGPKPPHLGVGASLPAEYLISEEERNTKALRARFFTPKILQASKKRDAEEKAASLKRGLGEESSDEDIGRSALGRPKKPQKTVRPVQPTYDDQTSHSPRLQGTTTSIKAQQNTSFSTSGSSKLVPKSDPRNHSFADTARIGSNVGGGRSSIHIKKLSPEREATPNKKDRRAAKVQKKKAKKQRLQKQYARLGKHRKDQRAT